MRRTLEKLANDRRSLENDIVRDASGLRDRFATESAPSQESPLDRAVARIEDIAKALEKASPAKKGFFRNGGFAAPERDFIVRTADALKEIRDLVDGHVRETRLRFAAILELCEKIGALGDARDREWDALGSNHVGMIFKSMEWRVDKLAAESEDVRILMTKFHLLREKLDALLQALEERRTPAPADVRDLLEPLEDWRYTGFENRYRGSEEEILNQQLGYLNDFRKDGKILDLGCGRGEFLDLLRENGFDGEGVDLNGTMIDLCLDKGLLCRKEDLLAHLASFKDGSLGGVFSSQVVEHLPFPYLKKMIETAFAKLEPGGAIVLETVNPVSVFALVQIYYLDLTHEKPVHPGALKFLLESVGFTDVAIRYSAPLGRERLQEIPGADERTSLLNRNIDSLNDLLFAPPNYAAIGKKA